MCVFMSSGGRVSINLGGLQQMTSVHRINPAYICVHLQEHQLLESISPLVLLFMKLINKCCLFCSRQESSINVEQHAVSAVLKWRQTYIQRVSYGVCISCCSH